MDGSSNQSKGSSAKEQGLKLNDQMKAVFKKKGYTIEEKLNEGAFGQVYKGKDTKTGTTVAIKVMFLSNNTAKYEKKFWPRELKALINIRHPYVIEIYDIIKADAKLFIFMEFANGGDIGGYLKKNGALPEPVACYWFTQTTQAMKYMHEEVFMAHRDIKIDNIMLHNNKAKVTDFGFARVATDESGNVIFSKTYCGTMPYYSPQIVSREPYNPYAADCWAMGVMLFCMLNLKFPFHWENPKEFYKEQTTKGFLKTRYVPPKGKDSFPEDLIDLQEQLLEPDESKRITMAQTIKHPWLLRKGK